MKTPSKTQLLQENTELRRERDLMQEYLSHAFRSKVTFIQKGPTRLGLCGECRAHGGVVLEAMKDDAGQWTVIGVYYFEARRDYVAKYPVRHDDDERQAWRTCYSQAARHVADIQHAFYAPRVVEALTA